MNGDRPNPHLQADDEFLIVHRDGREYRMSRCSYQALGERCCYPGTISSTTMDRGRSGTEPTSRWYCQQHHDCRDHEIGAQVVAQSRIPSAPRQEPPATNLPIRAGALAWAQRILDRVEAGEDVPRISVDWARAVLVRERPEREAGEDEGEAAEATQ